MMVRAMARKAVRAALPRKGFEAVGGKVGWALLWSVGNPGKAMSLYGVVLLAALVVTFAVSPEAAMATEWWETVGGTTMTSSPITGDASITLGSPTDGIAAMLRSFVNCILTSASDISQRMARGSLLTADFGKMLGDGNFAEHIKYVHGAVATPLASVVLAVVFTVALVKVVGKISANEGGVDTWQLVWLFVMAGIAQAVVSASWEIMQFVYTLSKAAIEATFQTAQAGSGVEFVKVADDINDLGALALMAVVSFILWGVTILACAAGNLVMIGRGLQIYLYTAFAPIPLAFMVSEGGRQVAVGFAKKYIAVLLAGVLLALMYIMLGLAINAMGEPMSKIGEVNDFMNWIVGYVTQAVVLAAFAWSFFKTGEWARDIVGA